MTGKLIIIEGSDGSGKATQSRLLTQRLKEIYTDTMQVSFPDYDSPSSGLIKMYLSGEFGDTAGSVDPYVASSFYTADRYASFKRVWERHYNAGGIVVSDRYTVSNMIHQGAKFDDEESLTSYLNWLTDYEYRLSRFQNRQLLCSWTCRPLYQMNGPRQEKINSQAKLLRTFTKGTSPTCKSHMTRQSNLRSGLTGQRSML